MCEYRFSLFSAQSVYISFFSCCSLTLKKATRRASSSETAIAQPHRAPKQNLPVAPLLDIDRMNGECNCSSFLETAGHGIFFGRTKGGRGGVGGE